MSLMSFPLENPRIFPCFPWVLLPQELIETAAPDLSAGLGKEALVYFREKSWYSQQIIGDTVGWCMVIMKYYEWFMVYWVTTGG